MTDIIARRRRARQRARLRGVVVLAAMTLVIVLLIVLVVRATSGGPPGHPTVTPPAAAIKQVGPPSIEAGVEPWQLPSPLSRQALIPKGENLDMLGGLTLSSASSDAVATIDPADGTVTPSGKLADPVHDGAGAAFGGSDFDFGGGSPTTVATVQSITPQSTPGQAAGSGADPVGSAVGQLPDPRSDLAVASITNGSGKHATTTAYIVGGYDGSTYLPGVLSTTDGTHFNHVADLPVPVRYPAVTSLGGRIYVFGGQIPSSSGGGSAAGGAATGSPTSTRSSTSAVEATDDIQEIDPASRTVKVVGHLPQALYGAASFVIDGHLYVAGGQEPTGRTLTGIEEFDQANGKVVVAGLLPQAVAFGAYATTGSGPSAVGYIAGGEVASQAGPDEAGMASGTLQTVISLRPSTYGGPAGPASAGAPYAGQLLIADRGNDRLLVIDPSRTIQWEYPSATMPPPPGGFYFPDDAFFIRSGTGIISNQEDNHTIVEIGYPSGKLLFQYGHPGVPGTAPGFLNQPDDAYLLKSGVITVADAMNDRILFISPQGQPISQIGTNGDAVHDPPTGIGYPNGDTPLANGDVLVSEINGSWITEYTPAGKLVWTLHLPVNYPSDPQELGSDLYLTCDYDPPAEGKILTFTREGAIQWTYDVKSGDGMLKKPSLSERLPNGLIMVNDDYRNRVVVIDPKYDTIVWQYGLTDTRGTSPGLIYIPDGFDLLEANGTTPTHPQTG